MRAQRRAVARGFTLAEVLATLAVLAIVLPVVMAALSQSVRVASRTRQRAVALELAQSKLAEVMALGEWQNAGGGDFGEAYPGFRWALAVAPWDEANTEQVQVQVSWTNQGAAESVTLTTLAYTGTASSGVFGNGVFNQPGLL
jgi:type II secretion system protein I